MKWILLIIGVSVWAFVLMLVADSVGDPAFIALAALIGCYYFLRWRHWAAIAAAETLLPVALGASAVALFGILLMIFDALRDPTAIGAWERSVGSVHRLLQVAVAPFTGWRIVPVVLALFAFSLFVHRPVLGRTMKHLKRLRIAAATIAAAGSFTFAADPLLARSEQDASGRLSARYQRLTEEERDALWQSATLNAIAEAWNDLNGSPYFVNVRVITEPWRAAGGADLRTLGRWLTETSSTTWTPAPPPSSVTYEEVVAQEQRTRRAVDFMDESRVLFERLVGAALDDTKKSVIDAELSFLQGLIDPDEHIVGGLITEWMRQMTNAGFKAFARRVTAPIVVLLRVRLEQLDPSAVARALKVRLTRYRDHYQAVATTAETKSAVQRDRYVPRVSRDDHDFVGSLAVAAGSIPDAPLLGSLAQSAAAAAVAAQPPRFWSFRGINGRLGRFTRNVRVR